MWKLRTQLLASSGDKPSQNDISRLPCPRWCRRKKLQWSGVSWWRLALMCRPQSNNSMSSMQSWNRSHESWQTWKMILFLPGWRFWWCHAGGGARGEVLILYHGQMGTDWIEVVFDLNRLLFTKCSHKKDRISRWPGCVHFFINFYHKCISIPSSHSTLSCVKIYFFPRWWWTMPLKNPKQYPAA